MDFWHNLEIIIIVAVVIYQIYHTVNLTKQINRFKQVFKDKLVVRKAFVSKDKIGVVNLYSTDVHFEDKIDLDQEEFLKLANQEILKLPLIDTEGKNSPIISMKNAINAYLVNNYGASVNFSIIKDIVDREIDLKDEEIGQSISLPLYLGLAATMIGIIFGLMSMNFSSEDTLGIIKPLITGVKVAMGGSLSGLLLTTYLSTFAYKKARNISQHDKNEQLTNLQATLLPELLKAEDSGVSGLKASLDQFSRVATQVSSNVLEAGQRTAENLALQTEVIEKVENLKVSKVSRMNLQLFEKLESNMDAFNHFSSFLDKMDKISSNMLDFANRTSDVSKVVENIDSTITESRNLNKFLSTHLDSVENFGDATLKSIGQVESHFEKAMFELNTRTQGMFDQINKSAGGHEASLEKIYAEIELQLSQVTKQYIESFSTAFAQSIPSFKKFDKLENLDTITVLLEQLQNNSDVLTKMDEMNADIQTNLSQIKNQDLEPLISLISQSIPSFKHLDKLEQLDAIKLSLQQLQSNRDILGKMDEMSSLLSKSRNKRTSSSSLDTPSSTDISSEKKVNQPNEEVKSAVYIAEALTGIFTKKK